jgi:hypothetical protein
MCTAATNRGHRGGPWRGPEAGAAGSSKAETNREPVPPRKCLWRRVSGTTPDAGDSPITQGRWRLCRDRSVLVDEPAEQVVPTDRE